MLVVHFAFRALSLASYGFFIKKFVAFIVDAANPFRVKANVEPMHWLHLRTNK